MLAVVWQQHKHKLPCVSSQNLLGTRAHLSYTALDKFVATCPLHSHLCIDSHATSKISFALNLKLESSLDNPQKRLSPLQKAVKNWRCCCCEHHKLNPIPLCIVLNQTICVTRQQEEVRKLFVPYPTLQHFRTEQYSQHDFFFVI